MFPAGWKRKTENSAGKRQGRTYTAIKRKKLFCGIALILAWAASACVNGQPGRPEAGEAAAAYGLETAVKNEDLVSADSWYENLPPYTGEASVSIHNGRPFFTEEEITEEAFEAYSDLDSLGRCGAAFANICEEIMPAEERGSIGNVKPTGWHTVKYDVIADRYLYNRCHLIGYQLAGENANEQNLITGTRYFNVEGMLPWENVVAEYVKETGGHVLYRVTPYFEGDNLVASGVLMEAYSVEDDGAGVCFNVYCYNVQPGVWIDYATGESRLDEAWSETEPGNQEEGESYVLNTGTKRFHIPSCASVRDIKDKNKENFTGDREELIENGYTPCGRCNP